MHIILHVAAPTAMLARSPCLSFSALRTWRFLIGETSPPFATFLGKRRLISPWDLWTLESIIRWEVFREPSLSDHRHILFTLRGSVPALLIRKLRGANWGSFREDLRYKLERGPELSMEDEAGLGLAVQWIQQSLVTAYEENCPLRPTKNGRKSEVDTGISVPQKRR